MNAVSEALEIGTVLSGRYTLSERLTDAEGERLYRATATWGETVLVTEFVGPAEGPEAARGRLAYLREAKVLTRVQHPGVIRTTDLFEERGTVYLIQEDRGWLSLRDQLSSGPLKPDVVLRMATEAYRALAAAHVGPVLHRRLAPERIWTEPGGAVTLARFGLGVAALIEVHQRFTPDPRYAAPEQLVQDASAATYSDLYSLAAVLVEALTGRTVPPASARAVGVPLPPFPEDTPPALQEALRRALKLDPAKRAVNASEVVQVLLLSPTVNSAAAESEPVMDAEPAGEPPGPAAPQSPAAQLSTPRPPPANSRRWLLPATLGTAVLLGLAFAWGSMSRGPSPQPVAAAPPPPTLQAAQEAPAAAAPAAVPSTPPPAAEQAPAAVPEAAPTPAPVEPVLEQVVGTQDLVLLDQPNGSTVQKLPEGMLLSVVEQQDGWVRITGNELAGWVSTDHLLTVHTAAETEALATELQAGGEVHVPSGVFVLVRPLTLGNSAVISGAGLDRSILISDAPEDTVILQGADFTVTGLTVTHRGRAPARTLMVSGGRVTLSEVHLSGAVRDEVQKAYGSGLWLSNGASADVTASQLTGNAYGLYVSDTSSATVSQSSLSHNSDGGGLFMDQSSGTLSHDVIEGNGVHGLHIRGTSTPHVQDNRIVGNGQRGLSVFEQAAPTVEQNTIERNGYQGIGVQDQASPDITGNTIRLNRQSGVTYFARAAGRLKGNTVSNNAKAGVAVTGDATPDLTNNTVEHNGENGLSFSDQAGGTASGNSIRFNSKPGISAWGTAHPTLNGNTISQSQQSGMVFAENASGTFSGNTIDRNALYGLIITGNATPFSSGNTVSGNLKGGIIYKQNAGGSSSGNICSGNGGPDLQVSVTAGSSGPSLADESCVLSRS